LAAPEVAEAEAQGLDAYDVISAEAAQVPPGAEGVKVVPHFMGAGSPYWLPEARGVVFGLSLGHSRAHIARAIMEGVAYEIKANLDLVAAQGISPQQVRLLGGGAYSALWRQIVASACNVEVALCGTAEAVSLGGAVLAAAAAGLYDSPLEAAKTMCRITEHTRPKPAESAVYAKEYTLYRDLMRALEPVFRASFG
jgi:xylulokinase